jgi:hypothetical protein
MGATGSLLARSQGEEVHAKSLPPISDETLREAGLECHFLVRTRVPTQTRDTMLRHKIPQRSVEQ